MPATEPSAGASFVRKRQGGFAEKQNLIILPFDGGVAQLGERLLCKQEVIGSIPFASMDRFAGIAANKQGVGGSIPLRSKLE